MAEHNRPMTLRQFTGNEAMGWKIAWSGRMISFYTSIWSFALAWSPLRRKIRPLPGWELVFLILLNTWDGITHTRSDLAGIGEGFRDTNEWLVVLTNNSFPASFYTDEAPGSFNSFTRFSTGLLAGPGIVWLTFPYTFQTRV